MGNNKSNEREASTAEKTEKLLEHAPETVHEGEERPDYLSVSARQTSPQGVSESDGEGRDSPYQALSESDTETREVRPKPRPPPQKRQSTVESKQEVPYQLGSESQSYQSPLLDPEALTKSSSTDVKYQPFNSKMEDVDKGDGAMKTCMERLRELFIYLFVIERVKGHRPLDYLAQGDYLKRILQVVAQYHTCQDFPWDSSSEIILSNYFGRYSAVSFIPALVALLSLFFSGSGAGLGINIVILVWDVFFFFYLLPREAHIFGSGGYPLEIYYVRPYKRWFGFVGLLLLLINSIIILVNTAALIALLLPILVYCFMVWPTETRFVKPMSRWIKEVQVSDTWICWIDGYLWKRISYNIVARDSLPAVWNEAFGDIPMGSWAPYSLFKDSLVYSTIQNVEHHYKVITRPRIDPQYNADTNQFSFYDRSLDISHFETPPTQKHWNEQTSVYHGVAKG